MPSKCSLPTNVSKDRIPYFLKGKADSSTHKSQEKAVSFCCQVSKEKTLNTPFLPKTPSLIK